MNYVSLFSSAGIGCYGLKQEGFECVATSELIERRLEVQKFNKKVDNPKGYILGDITNKDIKNKLYNVVDNYKDSIDIVIFTAPCQGMSLANHKKNDGTIIKNSLVVEALEITKKLKPKFFIAENVRTFMNTKCIDHNVEKKIKNAFFDWLSEDYNYIDKIINFKNYGANSSRTRTLVIGVRKDIKVLPIDLFPDEEDVKTLNEVIGHLPRLREMGESHKDDIFHNFKSYRKDMRNWIAHLKEGESAFNNKLPELRPHQIKNGIMVENVNKNGDKYKRQEWNKVAPCIHTRNDILASQNTIHPEDDRVFSIRELMLMMNIPNEFKWSNEEFDCLNRLNNEERKRFLKENEINIRQSIGEAIPPIIIQKIAKKIKECDNGEGKSN